MGSTCNFNGSLDVHVQLPMSVLVAKTRTGIILGQNGYEEI